MIPRLLSIRHERAAFDVRSSLLAGIVVALSLAAPSAVEAGTAQETTVSDGTRTLIVSLTDDLDPDAQTLRVRGSGYDVSKGIYVGLCVLQGDDQQPSPCGGGIDRSGSSGSSAWISSNPPAYGLGLAVPYADGGSFDVEITVSAAVNDAVDCRQVSCAIVTKNDHTIIDDRSQDLVIPVTFSGEPPPAPATTSVSTPSSDDSVSEITVSPGVDDLAEVATSGDGVAGWVPIIIAVGVLAVLSSIVWVSRRKASARRGR